MKVGLWLRTVRWPLLVGATILLGLSSGRAAETFFYPAREEERLQLLIHAATDRAAMEPLFRDFQAMHPSLAITYLDFNTNELFASVAEPSGAIVPDLVISSAMDLQAKLVNDGWTQPHVSRMTRRLPDWANWRDEAFGFTLEPAVIAYRRDSIAAGDVPRSRPELIRLLHEQAERFRSRVATYDIAASGIGYLFAANDAELSRDFWRLALAMGEVAAQLYPTSAQILAAIEHGDVLIGYNVLGTYARARRRAGAPIELVLPQDFTLVMSRVVTIPKAARSPELGKLFLDYLLSERGQGVVTEAAGLQAILPAGGAQDEELWPLSNATGPVNTITLGPALLVFLDPLKRSRFLADWSVSIHPP